MPAAKLRICTSDFALKSSNINRGQMFNDSAGLPYLGQQYPWKEKRNWTGWFEVKLETDGGRSQKKLHRPPQGCSFGIHTVPFISLITTHFLIQQWAFPQWHRSNVTRLRRKARLAARRRPAKVGLLCCAS
jgi:hypothetical protein